MDLFDALPAEPWAEVLTDGAVLLHGQALAVQHELIRAVSDLEASSPFRHMVTPGGFRMSVAMTNCGGYGWITDRKGYRYADIDPETAKPWPPIPPVMQTLATEAAAQAGFPNFEPDACLINRYAVGARMTQHQDKNELDFGQPIVSVSLGLPATFQLGGLERTDKTNRIRLEHGDVLVWGGPARLLYHGILPLKAGYHPAFGAFRINLTFRRAS